MKAAGHSRNIDLHVCMYLVQLHVYCFTSPQYTDVLYISLALPKIT